MHQCKTCGKEFHSYGAYAEHMEWGKILRTCDTCGGNRVKMIVNDPDSRRGVRTVYFCPKCAAATCHIHNKEFQGMKAIEGEDLTKLVRSYHAVADRG